MTVGDLADETWGPVKGKKKDKKTKKDKEDVEEESEVKGRYPHLNVYADILP